MENLGELAALATAFLWVGSAMSFESAGKRIGSLTVNLIRLWIGFALLTLFCTFFCGHALPLNLDAHAWGWLALSGVAGFLIGDLSLFRAFILIGSRLSMLVMCLVPPISAIAGWILLDEQLTGKDLLGMAITISGVAWVVFERKPAGQTMDRKTLTLGLLLAFAGATGQAIGLVFSKVGMGQNNPFAATQIRIIAGIIGFTVLFTVIGWWPRVWAALKDRPAMTRTGAGAFFGPFLGVSMSLTAVKYTEAGIAATIMSIVPILMIPPAILIFKENVSLRAVIGSFVAVGGVALLFL